MRESTIEKYLVQQVKARGGEVRKLQWIGRRGAPDRVILWHGSPSVIWIELKAPGKKPEAHQLREHERMRRMGQVVLVLDSIEAVDNFLREWIR